MSDDLEKALRAALQPVDPGEDFSRRVMARAAQEGRRRSFQPHPAWWALAASVLLAAVAVHLYQVHRRAQGLEARAQLLQALQVTGRKLDVVYRALNDPGARASSRPDGV